MQHVERKLRGPGLQDVLERGERVEGEILLSHHVLAYLCEAEAVLAADLAHSCDAFVESCLGAQNSDDGARKFVLSSPGDGD